ncbi:MAG: PEP-CTERM sorting domain-containing protein [Nitrosospira sp.]
MNYLERTRAACFLHALLNSGVLAGCLIASTAHSGITFQFNYTDSAGTGFLDPVDGVRRQAALNTAASEFSNMFGSHFSNTGTIFLDAAAEDMAGALAGANTYLMDPGKPGFNLAEVVRTKLQTGIDLNGNNADGAVSVNFSQPWALDVNSPPTEYSGQYDFYGTLYHELTHTLGFTRGGITKTGEPLAGSKEAGTWSTFASFIVDKHGDKIIDPNTFALNQPGWDVSSIGDYSAGNDGEGLFFDGPNAVAANGGYWVTLYTPAPWENGSSIAHLDPDMPGISGMLMTPAAGTGLQAHGFSPIEVGMLKDLGYVSAVPEPETYSMLLAGLAVCGWIARRRQA